MRAYLIHLLIALGGVLLIAGAALAFWHAPLESRMGLSQKIFYFHVPSAVATYLGFGLCGVASLVFILKPLPWLPRLALAGAEVGAIFALAVLTTGPLWAYKAWGKAWMWDPRLSSVLLTFLIFSGYLMLRRFAEDSELSARLGAVMGTLGLLGIALSRFSVQLWGGFHPQVLTGRGEGIAAQMVPAFAVSMLGIGIFALSLIALRCAQLAQREKLEALEVRLEEQLERRNQGAP